MAGEIKPMHIADALACIRAIAANTERIADALEAANANDPVAMIAKAMEAEQVEPLAHIPPEERYRFG